MISCAKNGVVKVTISRSTFFEISQRGDITPFNGKYFNDGGQEYRIVPSVASKFIKQFRLYK